VQHYNPLRDSGGEGSITRAQSWRPSWRKGSVHRRQSGSKPPSIDWARPNWTGSSNKRPWIVITSRNRPLGFTPWWRTISSSRLT